ncbi:hypothetical protein KZZ52_07185 [Dactylosporangium sp. AC04546]|uniref:hypothetical protein n=1 Tax=Dactylosporangium sp. AC04546 TaxID=2862460 RepID=UPI001EDE4CEA|nr:hypothetical protein [Dactylosporangium sp. AC04546]WVK85178.1 hypothetical protein KZZ52_07185 [Dactylosporangium sp. AC04546]
MTRSFRGLAVAFVIPLVLGIAACSDKKSDDASNESASDRPTVEVTAQPQDAASAQVTAEQLFDNLSEGDWAGAYDLWTEAAKTSIAKDAYIDLVATCTAQQGEYMVTGVTPVDDATATIKWSHTPTGSTAAPLIGTSTVRYQNGAWRFEPDAVSLAAYKQNKCP